MPTVTKADMVARVVDRLKSGEVPTAFPTKVAVTHVIDALYAEMQSALLDEDKVAIPGIGVLTVKAYESRMGVNPATGAPITIPARFRLKLSASTKLQYALNLKMEADAKNAA